MSDQHLQISNLEAIHDCIDLSNRYPIEECLVQCQKFCDSLDDEKQFVELMQSERNKPCMREIIDLSVIKYGARNVFSALLYVAGDIDGHQFQLQAHKYAAQRAHDELIEILGFE